MSKGCANPREAEHRIRDAAPDMFEALGAMLADHEAIQCKPWPSYANAKAVLDAAIAMETQRAETVEQGSRNE